MQGGARFVPLCGNGGGCALCGLFVSGCPRAWPKPRRIIREGGGVGGGYDGVVVWELHSGREHLVCRRVKHLSSGEGYRTCPVFLVPGVGSERGGACKIAISLMNEDPGPHLGVVPWFSR